MLEGAVDLLTGVRPNRQYVRKTNLCCTALQHRSARHAFPGVEGLGAQGPLFLRVGVVTAMHKEADHLIVGRSETLQVTRRLEAGHPFSRIRGGWCGFFARLDRHIRPVGQIYVGGCPAALRCRFQT